MTGEEAIAFGNRVIDLGFRDETQAFCEMAIKALEFAEWVAEEIFSDNWEYNKDSFAEIVCRKLEKVGIVKLVDEHWVLVESEEV